MDRRVRPGRGGPDGGSRREQGGPHGLGRAGDRHRDRPGHVGVACAGTRAARRIAVRHSQRTAIRGTTHTSTRSTRGRAATCCSRLAAPGRCTTSIFTAGACAGASGAAAAASSSDPASPSTGSTTHASRAGPYLAVRQRLGTAEGEAVSRPRAVALAEHALRLARQSVRQPDADAAVQQPGLDVRAGGRQLAARLRAAPRLHRVRRRTGAFCSMPRSAATYRTSASASPRGRAAPVRSRRCSPSGSHPTVSRCT